MNRSAPRPVRPFMLRNTHKLVIAAVAVTVSVMLAGCGGGSQSPTTTSHPAGSASSSSNAATMFSTASVSGLGTVVVDGKGRTVYILTSGGHTNVPCNDASGCTGLWPDLPFPKGVSAAKAGSGIKASLLGSKKLSDGETYPTYNGWLMYEYAGDSGPGDSKGQSIKSFGGTWFVLDGSGNPVTKSAGGSGGRYGY
jgi:predicted lipoprotein with Yx(FWY)xxD motif